MTDSLPAVLVVDDTAANRRLYELMLRDTGVSLLQAGSADDALALAAGQDLALVLLDVHLGADSGFDVARRLRQAQPPVQAPIVFVSAVYTHDADVFKGYQLGAVDYILSPVVPQILRAKVEGFVAQHRLRRQAQAQTRAVEQAYAKLQQAHRDLERFSFTVSHDLRTPLSHILGFAQLLQQRSGATLDAQGQDWLQRIIQSGRRMNGLIDDLLLLARLSHQPLQTVLVDITALAQDIVATLGGTAPARSVRWDIAAGLQAWGDEGLLRLALTNLLSNAFKYSAQREEAVIALQRVDDAPTFCVSDNGDGFDVAAAGPRLFQPFQRFHQDTQFQGHGVGLSVVQQVVLRHGGRVWAASLPGQGANFFFSLPLQPDASEPTP